MHWHRYFLSLISPRSRLTRCFVKIQNSLYFVLTISPFSNKKGLFPISSLRHPQDLDFPVVNPWVFLITIFPQSHRHSKRGLLLLFLLVLFSTRLMTVKRPNRSFVKTLAAVYSFKRFPLPQPQPFIVSDVSWYGKRKVVLPHSHRHFQLGFPSLCVLALYN